METDVSQNFQEYWNEILHETKLDDFVNEQDAFGPRSYEDGEQEAEWLRNVGLDQLAAPYLEGRELPESELGPVVRLLPNHQADAVRRRVRTLNLTVRGRGQHRHTRHRKPDIRDVFRDVENSSTGTRSRSATPDSLDAELPTSSPILWPNDLYSEPSKEPIRRLPSTPTPIPHTGQDLFRRFSHFKGDIASDSGDGIQMVGFQHLSTLHLPRPRERHRSSSDPINVSSSVPVTHSTPMTASFTTRLQIKNDHHSLSRSQSSLYSPDEAVVQRAAARAVLRRAGSQSHIRCQLKHLNCDSVNLNYPDDILVGKTWVDYLGEADMAKLHPLLIFEVTALLDQYNIPFHKRKSPKKKRKEDGLFGTSIVTMLERDRIITGDPVPIPIIFHKLLSHLDRCGTKEEGILRLAGVKHKVDAVISQLEREPFSQPDQLDRLFQQLTCHDLVALLKRFIRDLPSPLLTVEYLDIFYQTHALVDMNVRLRALNLLVLLLPVECRNLLRALFNFLLKVIRNEATTKMTVYNVAVVMAPSLFPPSLMRATRKKDLDAQVNIASICCRITESMLQYGELLWVVPNELVSQIREVNEQERYKKVSKENKPMKRLLGRSKAETQPIARKIDNEVDFQEGVIRIQALQFQVENHPIQLSDHMTAGNVLLKVVEEATKDTDLSPTILKVSRKHRFDIKSRALIELAPNGSFNCFLATGSPEMTLQTHFLYEIGGNIAQRQIEHNAVMIAVYKENPNAQWIIKCHHRTSHNTVPN